MEFFSGSDTRGLSEFRSEDASLQIVSISRSFFSTIISSTLTEKTVRHQEAEETAATKWRPDQQEETWRSRWAVPVGGGGV